MSRKQGYGRLKHAKTTDALSAPPEQLQSLVEMAEAVRPVILAHEMAAVDRIMAGHDIVWGIWQDMSAPNGVGSMLVKGISTIRSIAAGSESVAVAVAAIPCLSIEQAYALKLIRGDGSDTRSLQ